MIRIILKNGLFVFYLFLCYNNVLAQNNTTTALQSKFVSDVFSASDGDWYFKNTYGQLSSSWSSWGFQRIDTSGIISNLKELYVSSPTRWQNGSFNIFDSIYTNVYYGYQLSSPISLYFSSLVVYDSAGVGKNHLYFQSKDSLTTYVSSTIRRGNELIFTGGCGGSAASNPDRIITLYTDLNGNLLKSRTYAIDSLHSIMWPKATNDTGLVYLARTSNSTSILLKVDKDGAEVWSKKLIHTDYQFQGFISDSLGNFYLKGISSALGSSLLKLDNNGNMIWHKVFPTHFSLHEIDLLSNTKILITGNINDTTSGDKFASIYCLDDMGNYLWGHNSTEKLGQINAQSAVSTQGEILFLYCTKKQIDDSWTYFMQTIPNDGSSFCYSIPDTLFPGTGSAVTMVPVTIIPDSGITIYASTIYNASSFDEPEGTIVCSNNIIQKKYLSGKLFTDLNLNGVVDTLEPLSNISAAVKINPGSLSKKFVEATFATWVNVDSISVLAVDTVPKRSITPLKHIIDFMNPSLLDTNVNFSISTYYDNEINLYTNCNQLIPGASFDVNIFPKRKGDCINPMHIILAYDSSLVTFNSGGTSSGVDSVTGNQIFWFYNCSFPSSTYARFNVKPNVSPGSKVKFIAELVSADLDETPKNNKATFIDEVVVSPVRFHKTVSTDTLTTKELRDGKYLYYTLKIGDEQAGTFTGNTVPGMLIDIVDHISPYLDISTFELVQTSQLVNANYNINALNREITFGYEMDGHIWYPPGSGPSGHRVYSGCLTYRIKPYKYLGAGSIIDNYGNASSFWPTFVPFFTDTVNTVIVLDTTGEFLNSQGKIYLDTNLNATYQPVEPLYTAPFSFNVEPDNNLVITNTGEWNIILDTNETYIYKPVSQVNYFNLVPDSHLVVAGIVSSIDSSKNFGLQATNSVIDYSITISSINGARLNQPYYEQINACNLGTDVSPCTIIYTWDSLLTFVSATIAPDSIVQNTAYWNFANIVPGSCQPIRVTLDIPGVPVVFPGNDFSNYVHLSTLLFDTEQNNNFAIPAAPIIIVGAFDPNDKLVSAGSITTVDVLNEAWIEYTIRFQNIGNAPAIDVRLEDDISPKLNSGSFTFIDASHPFSVILSNFHLTVLFDSIMLPDSVNNEPLSHGFFKYKLRVQSYLSEGVIIQNLADIYFDLNPPVRTNTVETQVVCSVETVTKSHKSVSCYGANDGLAQVVLPGGGPFTYNWNTAPPMTTSVVNNLPAGIYEVNITDAAGCEITEQFRILEPFPLVLFTIPGNSNPAGSSTGSINLLVQGGVGPYEYLWSSGSTTEDIQNLSPGIYHVTVSDRHGCANLQTVIIN